MHVLLPIANEVTCCGANLKTWDVWGNFSFFHIAWNGFRAYQPCFIQCGSCFCGTESDPYMKTWRLMSGDFINAPILFNAMVIIIRAALPVFIYVCRYCHVLGWLIDGFWIGWLDLLHLIHSQLGTTGNTALSLYYTLCSSPLHTH
jgi:hypothetical protein